MVNWLLDNLGQLRQNRLPEDVRHREVQLSLTGKPGHFHRGHLVAADMDEIIVCFDMLCGERGCDLVGVDCRYMRV